MGRYNKEYKARPKRKQGEQVNVCDDCVSATWDMKFQNLDTQGKPILLRCPLEEYAIIRGTKACGDFQHK